MLHDNGVRSVKWGDFEASFDEVFKAFSFTPVRFREEAEGSSGGLNQESSLRERSQSG